MKQSHPIESERQNNNRSHLAVSNASPASQTFVDNRESTALQRQLIAKMTNSPQAIAQRQLSDQIHNSPRMIIQRQQMAAISGGAVQRVEGEEELVQGKLKPVQRVEEEELLQGKFSVAQRVEEEELMQGKFDTAQRVEEEELMQGKFDTVQRVEEEELLQGKFATVQRVEEEELMQGKFNTAQLEQAPDEKANNTGLPDNLKQGIENLSGMSMDNVKVHYNSSKPAQLNALAYAQGTDIHLGAGQEKHLPHEAWHVVQQAQGRVKPTMQMREGVPVNDDQALEHEADVMGAKAISSGVALAKQELSSSIESGPIGKQAKQLRAIYPTPNSSPLSNIVAQFVLSAEEVEEWADLPEDQYDWMDAQEKAQVGRYKSANAEQKKVNEATTAALESREYGARHVSWEYGGKKYHINLQLGVYHITEEATPKIHYFFQGYGVDLTDKPSGNGGKRDKLFSELPKQVQTFIKQNYEDLLL